MPSGYYMEFGILNGHGIIDAYRQLRGSQVAHYFGFDSFQGLPKLDEKDGASRELMPIFYEGNYKGGSEAMVRSNIISNTGMKHDQLTLVEGFFEESLPKINIDHIKQHGELLVAYIDCDLYSSTKTVLNFLEPLITDGTWVVFDDYWCYRGSPYHGQRLAIEEMLSTTKSFGLTDYTNFYGFGKAYIGYKKGHHGVGDKK